MKLVIIGATGLSGRYFIDRLEKENFKGEIICIVRETSKVEHLAGRDLDLTYLIGEITDKMLLAKALKSADTFVNIAGISVSSTMLEAAKENNVKWLITVHTTGRYSKYKSASEGYIEIEESIEKTKGDIAVTIVRPTMIYGGKLDHNMHKLIAYLDRYPLFPLFGTGDNLMQPIHGRDLGNAYYDILIRPQITMNKSYNLSGQHPMSYIDIIKTTSSQLGGKTLIVKIPFGISLYAVKVYNLLLKNRAIISVEQVLRMQEDKDFSHEEAKIDFGFNPICFADGIKEEIDGLKKED